MQNITNLESYCTFHVPNNVKLKDPCSFPQTSTKAGLLAAQGAASR